MANRPLLIIHGWSDSSTSLKKLANSIESQTGRNVQTINLADYISMDDEVTFYDLASAMQGAWLTNKLPISEGSVDVIAHSAGALVVRTWLQMFYKKGQAPIKNLVLLAPANFGSHLAHKGRAFYSRIVKGFKSKKMFQVGARLLKGLELASPYSFNLALADRFNEDSYFGAGKILCTILTGNSGYTGISAAANEDGSDGAVRISAANLNTALLTIDFSESPLQPTYTYELSSGKVAFAIMDLENHSTIIGQANGFATKDTLAFIIQGLMVRDKEFDDWCEKTTRHNQLIMNQNLNVTRKHGFQNTVCFVYDQFDQHVSEYFLEFYGTESGVDRIAEVFHQDTIQTVHAYSDDASFRSLYMDCTHLYQAFTDIKYKLMLSLVAMPEFKKQGDVGYRTFNDDDIGSIELSHEEMAAIFQENRTLLVKIKLKREQSDSLFQLKPLR